MGRKSPTGGIGGVGWFGADKIVQKNLRLGGGYFFLPKKSPKVGWPYLVRRQVVVPARSGILDSKD